MNGSAKADVYFGLNFPKLTPDALREEIRLVAGHLIDGHAPEHIRQGWLNRDFNGEPSHRAMHAHANACLAEASRALSARATASEDTYCWQDTRVVCYSGFEAFCNGSQLIARAEADGLGMDCPIRLVLAYRP